MELSPNAARALDQVKMGLYMLYGANYFTEEEWIKVDGLIHKGKYVFTNGPPNVIEEELMSFDDFADKTTTAPVNQPFDTIQQGTVIVEVRSINSDNAEMSDPVETPNFTSAEASSDEESPKLTPMFDFSEPTMSATDTSSVHESAKPAQHSDLFEMASGIEHKSDTDGPHLPKENELPEPDHSTTEIEASAYTKPEGTKSIPDIEPEQFVPPERKPVEIPVQGGLALGYTQAQLDEVRQFNANLTKAGKKSRPKYTREEASPEPSWSAEPEPLPSANHSDHNRIQSWASEVDAQATIASPSPSLARPVAPPTPIQPLATAFKKTYGKPPRSINDLVQPNNPGFKPLTQRSVSRASNVTSKPGSIAIKGKTPAAPMIHIGPGNPKLRVPVGTVLKAQSDAPAKGIQMEVQEGDQIRVMTHVSGTMHAGVNLRTGKDGQFSEKIFMRLSKSAAGKLKENEIKLANEMLVQRQQDIARQRSPSLFSNGLDRVENINAAEWDEEVSRPKTTAPRVQRPVPKPLGGLAASRFAVLSDYKEEREESESVAGSAGPEFTGLSKEEIGRVIDEKFAQILAAQRNAMSSTPQPQSSRKTRLNTLSAPLVEPIPKTTTCWFWATPNKGCRFTADECRDLHAILPVQPGQPANLRMGKPSWGALADSLPKIPATDANGSWTEASSKSNLGTAGTSLDVHNKTMKTCWYWANEHCQNAPEQCKYLHAYCAGGVAVRPGHWRKSDWNRWGSHRENNRSLSGDARTGSWGQENENEQAGSFESVDDDGEEGDEDGELILEEVGDVGESWRQEREGSVDSKYRPPHIVKALEAQAAEW